MPRIFLASALPLFVVIGCSLPGCQKSAEHGHPPGSHGGIIAALGEDHYHVEALFTDEGQLHLYMLGQDESQIVDVETQNLTAYVRQPRDAASKPIVLKPSPQKGDRADHTSLFVGELPTDMASELLVVAIPMIQIDGRRYRFSFTTTEPLMPRKVTHDAERDLYLTPGGAYTAADIAANGSVTASQKYQGFRSNHDSHPQAGERICPISNTKASAACTWIIAGEEYQFCCPPCIDEFVARAKQHPQLIKPAEQYRQP